MFKDSLKTIALSLIILSLVGIAYAWTEPSQSPPSGNLSAPITISSDNQTKSGNLVVNALAVSNSASNALTVTGGVQASSFLYSSDRSLKTDISKIENALGKILNLDGVNFKWKENGKADMGLIAQDVEKVLPEIVSTNQATGLKSVEYGNLAAVLIEAIKEQQVEIEALKAEVANLKNK